MKIQKSTQYLHLAGLFLIISISGFYGVFYLTHVLPENFWATIPIVITIVLAIMFFLLLTAAALIDIPEHRREERRIRERMREEAEEERRRQARLSPNERNNRTTR